MDELFARFQFKLWTAFSCQWPAVELYQVCVIRSPLDSTIKRKILVSEADICLITSWKFSSQTDFMLEYERKRSELLQNFVYNKIFLNVLLAL